MGEINYTPSLAELFTRIERRLLALETAPSLTSSSQRGGSLQILDPATGNPLVILGVQPAANGSGYGLSVRNANGRLLFDIDTVNGYGVPLLPVAMSVSNTAVSNIGGSPYYGTASGTLTETYVGDFWASGGQLVLNNWAYIGGGATSMDWSVTIEERPSFTNAGVLGTITTIASGTGVTASINVASTVTIPAGAISSGRTGTDPRGSLFRLRFMARVAGGAGLAALVPVTQPLNYG